MTEVPKISESEYRFCEILWNNEPVSSNRLVKLCDEQLEWKKSTTYTVIRRLCDKGIIKSENATVSAVYSRDEIREAHSKEMVDREFSGSLPVFIAAFMKKSKLSPKDIMEIQSIIDSYK